MVNDSSFFCNFLGKITFFFFLPRGFPLCLEQPSLCSVFPSCLAEPAHEPACLPDGVRVEGRAAQLLAAAATAGFLMLRCSWILGLALEGLVPVLLLLSYTKDMQSITAAREGRVSSAGCQ